MNTRASTDKPVPANLAPSGTWAGAHPTEPADADDVRAGTSIEVELDEVIDSDATAGGRFVPATISRDVLGRSGKRAIPSGSPAVIVIRTADKKDGHSAIGLALYQVTVANKSYLLMHGSKDLAELSIKENAALGEGHRSVHLRKRTPLQFVLEEEIQFRP